MVFAEQKALRLSQLKAAFLKNTIREHLNDASVYLFGSRAHDDQRGGDIDILVIGKRQRYRTVIEDIKTVIDGANLLEKLEIIIIPLLEK